MIADAEIHNQTLTELQDSGWRDGGSIIWAIGGQNHEGGTLRAILP